MKKFRAISLFHDEDWESGTTYFVFPAGSDHGEMMEALDCHGYEPHGRHNTSMYDCSGMLCCGRVFAARETAKRVILQQNFYRDI